MLGETNGFEGILVADLFYVVTLTDTVRCYITSPEKADRVQERNPSASPKSLCHTRKKRPTVLAERRPFFLPPKSFLPRSIPSASFAVTKNRIDCVLNAHAL